MNITLYEIFRQTYRLSFTLKGGLGGIPKLSFQYRSFNGVSLTLSVTSPFTGKKKKGKSEVSRFIYKNNNISYLYKFT